MAAIQDLTDGRGADSVIDAVGMESHGSPMAAGMKAATGALPDAIAAQMTEEVGLDRLEALTDAIGAVRGGGTVSIAGVYGGAVEPLPMMTMFDKAFRSGWARLMSSGESETSCRSCSTIPTP